MLDMRLHLCVSIWYRVCHVYFIAWIHESVVKAHGPVCTLLLRIQVVDFFLVGGDFVGHVGAAVLYPAAFTLLQIPVHLCRPD